MVDLGITQLTDIVAPLCDQSSAAFLPASAFLGPLRDQRADNRPDEPTIAPPKAEPPLMSATAISDTTAASLAWSRTTCLPRPTGPPE
jgi:hypothetical protein